MYHLTEIFTSSFIRKDEQQRYLQCGTFPSAQQTLSCLHFYRTAYCNTPSGVTSRTLPALTFTDGDKGIRQIARWLTLSDLSDKKFDFSKKIAVHYLLLVT